MGPMQTAPEPGQEGPADLRNKTFMEVDLCIPTDNIFRHLGTKQKCHNIYNPTVTFTVDICTEMAKQGPRSLETAIPQFGDLKFWIYHNAVPSLMFFVMGFYIDWNFFQLLLLDPSISQSGRQKQSSPPCSVSFPPGPSHKETQNPQRSQILKEK